MKNLILWCQWTLFEAWMQGRWHIDLRRILFLNLLMPEKKPPRQDVP